MTSEGKRTCRFGQLERILRTDKWNAPLRLKRLNILEIGTLDIGTGIVDYLKAEND